MVLLLEASVQPHQALQKLHRAGCQGLPGVGGLLTPPRAATPRSGAGGWGPDGAASLPGGWGEDLKGAKGQPQEVG